MSEKQFRLEIVTPASLKYEGDVQMVRLPGVEGEMGILANHAPLLAMLNPGILVYRLKGEDHSLATGEGFVKVAENRVVVMVDSAERPDEIDPAKAETQRQAVERDLAAHSGPEGDRLRTQLMLAQARQKVAGRRA